MTEAMPFLQKAILLSYAPRPFCGGIFAGYRSVPKGRVRSAGCAAREGGRNHRTPAGNGNRSRAAIQAAPTRTRRRFRL